MAETDNIARIAELVSKDVFGVFGWRRIGPMNENWACRTDSHAMKLGTHPSDVVFQYEDPYGDKNVYVNVDLKSYAAGSIDKGHLNIAIQNMAKSTECANISDQWLSLYAGSDPNWIAVGLLFIYNHDQTYDKDFSKLLFTVPDNAFQLQKSRKMFIFGPETINYLINITNDLINLRGRKEIPDDPSVYYFYYPHLILAKARVNRHRSATLEMLLGPWQIVGFPGKGGNQLLVYYKGKGESEDEFTYLIEYFFHYQLIDDHIIEIRLPLADGQATVHFKRAIERMAHRMESIRSKLERIRCEVVPTLRPNFSPIQIGMRDE